MNNNDNTVNQNNQNVNNVGNNPQIINPLEINKETGNVQTSNSSNVSNESSNISSTIPVVSPDAVASTISNTANVNPTNVVTPQNVTSGNETTGDGDAMVNEKLKKVEINYTPPSRFKLVMLVLFFIGLIAFVIFLPDINTMINKYKNGNPDEEVITSGILKCTFQSNSSELDMDYLREFTFTASKLEKANYTLTTKGDPTLDEEKLNEMNKQCVLLEESVAEMTGITVSCKYSDGKLVERQLFEFQGIKKDELTAAFAEAGGTYPEFSLGQNIDEIEKTMLAAGYTCVRNRQ